MVELWQLSAASLTEGYSAADFTPAEVLDAVLSRCDAVNLQINAVIARDDANARASAEESGRRWRAGCALSPLDGVPVSVKDNLLLAGMPATWGSRGLADYIPDHDELPVARLRAGGAVLFAKTNVPELTVQGYTSNLLFGATGLHVAPELTPGGSSGGAAAAVAAGIGPLALGTDGGGSIRRPAAHAGLYGLKPGTARIPRGRGFPAILGSFEVVGQLGREPGDVMRMFQWLAGPAEMPEHRRNHILYARRFSGQPVDPEILHACDDAAARFARLGHVVTTIENFDATSATDRIWPIISCSGVCYLLRSDPRIADAASSTIREIAEVGSGFSGADYAAALVELEDMRLQYFEAMSGYDLLMTPAIAALAWPKSATHPQEIADQPVGPRGHAVFTAFANALGIPAITIPIAVCSNGSGIGIQMVGKQNDEMLLLQLADQYSRDLAGR